VLGVTRPLLLVGCLLLTLPACELLGALAGPAATAAGAGLGAYEAQVRAQASAAGAHASDPAVLAAIEVAREEDARAARESKARDEAAAAESKARAAAEAKRAARIAAELAALRRPCPACPRCPEALPPAPVVLPVADAGADDAAADGVLVR